MKRTPFSESSCVFLVLCSVIVVSFFGAAVVAQAPAVTGDQKTVVIVTNFTDQAVTCSVESIRKIMFDPTLSVAALVRDTLAGRLRSPATCRTLHAKRPSTDPCSLSSLGLAAEESAESAGSMSRYPRRVYVMHPTAAEERHQAPGGTPSYSWISRATWKALFS